MVNNFPETRWFLALIEDANDPLNLDSDWLIIDALAEDHLTNALDPKLEDDGYPMEWDTLLLRCRHTKLKARTGRTYGDRSVWYRVLVAATPVAGDVKAEVVLLGDTEGGAPPELGIREVSFAPESIARDLTRWAMLTGRSRSNAAFISGLLDMALDGTEGIAVAAYDVGQGNCNAIVDQHEHPRILFDFGWPPNFHAATRPAQRPDLLGCDAHARAPVVLSHWDMDHWAFAVRKSSYDSRNMSSRPIWDVPALERFWVARAPRKKAHQLGPMHMSLYQQLSWKELFPGMSALQTWPNSLRRVRFSWGWIEACEPAKGAKRDRNNTGLAMFVENRRGDLVLLAGDADFTSIRSLAKKVARKSRLVGLVAPHHGARITVPAVPPPKKGSAATLVYSVGQGNQYGHPKEQALSAYREKGWRDHWTSHRTTCAHGHMLGNRLLRFPRDPVPQCICGCVHQSFLCLSTAKGPSKKRAQTPTAQATTEQAAAVAA